MVLISFPVLGKEVGRGEERLYILVPVKKN